MTIAEKDIFDLAETLSNLSETQGQILLAQTAWAMAESLLCCGYRKFEIVDEPAAPADGGPAFGELKQVGDRAIKQGGMTIRDYFAASALQGVLANQSLLSRLATEATGADVSAFSRFAKFSIELADEVLKERAK